ncbi:MAG: Hpt domain-containing protein, partial [Lachnospiraceae bacterium]|nr:Hpt domain-containing protein [Lachnospiraceae bacterium]
MDVSQYLDMFLDETKEHLQNLSDQIMHLEEDPEDADTINEIFRAAHTLKGMAGTMGFTRMQTLTHDMENVFSEIRSGKLKVQPKIIDTFFSCLDALDGYVQTIQNTSSEGTEENGELIAKLNDCLPKKEEEAPKPATEVKAPEKPVANPKAGGKWNEMKLDDAIISAIREAREDGDECYGLNVVIQEKCLLKAARAFLVLRSVGERGEIIAANPSTQDIEDEKFDRDFTLIVISDLPVEEMVKAIQGISEIEQVTGGVLVLPGDAPAPAEAQTVSASPAPATTVAPASPQAATTSEAPKTQSAEAGEKKATAVKHVANKTIRVDIEKLDELMNLVSELIIAKNSIVSATQTGQGNSKSAIKDNIEYLERV